MNHSCDPNSNSHLINDNDPLHYKCVALKDIQTGEELNCNYNSFVFTMEGFDCNCGAKNCYGKIEGFKNLTVQQQREMGDNIEIASYFFTLYDLDYLKK